MSGGYNSVQCLGFPTLNVMQNHEGRYFVGSTSAIMLITGQKEVHASSTMTKFMAKHYPEPRSFRCIGDNMDGSEHIVQYKTAAGRSSYAFSVSGLEYLCTNLSGFAAFANRSQFLKLIEDFKRSLPYKRPHASSGDGTPDPKRAANDLVNPLTTEGDDSMLPVAVVKQALIAHSAMISDEVVKAVEPFHQAVVSSQQQMYQGNQELRDEVCKIEMKAETLVENTSTIARGIMTETVANRDKISRMEYQLARLNQVIREKDAQIERLNLQLDDDLRTVSDNVVTLKHEIDGFKARFDSLEAGLKTIVDLLLPGA